MELLVARVFVRSPRRAAKSVASSKRRFGPRSVSGLRHTAGHNYWFVRTPWDSGPFPETTVAGAAQPGR
jgi:hypothetical protein